MRVRFNINIMISLTAMGAATTEMRHVDHFDWDGVPEVTKDANAQGEAEQGKRKE